MEHLHPPAPPRGSLGVPRDSRGSQGELAAPRGPPQEGGELDAKVGHFKVKQWDLARCGAVARGAAGTGCPSMDSQKERSSPHSDT